MKESSGNRSLAQTLLNNKNLVVNADKLVAKIATHISDSGGERNVPVGVVLQLVKECSQTKSAAAAAPTLTVATNNNSSNEPPKWHCQPMIRDESYKRKRQKQMKILREKLHELITGGNLTMALDICRIWKPI